MSASDSLFQFVTRREPFVFCLMQPLRWHQPPTTSRFFAPSFFFFQLGDWFSQSIGINQGTLSFERWPGRQQQQLCETCLAASLHHWHARSHVWTRWMPSIKWMSVNVKGLAHVWNSKLYVSVIWCVQVQEVQPVFIAVTVVSIKLYGQRRDVVDFPLIMDSA